MDKRKIEEAVRLFLKAIGENPNREGLKSTPRRIAEMCEEIFSGLKTDPSKEMVCYKAKNEDEMIMVKDIPFYSVCEHHLLPFFGKAHIVYIPRDNRITGFSTLVRIIDIMSKRPQLQERLTSEIADFLMNTLKPLGLLIVIEAEHLCLSMRGVKKPGALTITSSIRGVMRSPATRAEAFSLIKNSK
ncbi:MAG: GTP cyclohydrolase I FolE [candidate division WOR-3 bacterium]